MFRVLLAELKKTKRFCKAPMALDEEEQLSSDERSGGRFVDDCSHSSSTPIVHQVANFLI